MRNWSVKIVALLLIMTLVIVGCSNNGGEKNNVEPTSQATANEQQEENNKEDAETQVEAEERIVKHIMGETKIVGTPERVVVLTQEGTEAVLELGVKPVGAVNSGLGDDWFPHILEEMQGVTELGDETQPNIELIVSLQPDLIIGNKVRHEKIYDQLSDIAPTVFSEDLAGQWKNNFKLYAEALNLVAEGEEAMNRYNAHIEEAKATLGDKVQKEVSIVRFLPQAVRLYLKDTFAGVALSDLGFARPAAQDLDEFMVVITKEQIADMDGDIMFYFNADYDEEKGGTKNQEEWMSDPLYQNLNIAKNNMAFKVDEVIWNLSGGIKAANLLIDQIVEYAENL